eukprot:CCRYP_011955-RA/>CCRYP_011955-RA protein AED:0.39 eAED:0.39 QI:0/-1/0/1/-1/1/1/0/123
MFVMTHSQVKNIPKPYRHLRTSLSTTAQKGDPNRVRITAGSNLIKDYPGELTSALADLTTSKILWNSVLSTTGAKFMGLDLKSFYLTAMLDRPEYMKMPLALFPTISGPNTTLTNTPSTGSYI